MLFIKGPCNTKLLFFLQPTFKWKHNTVLFRKSKEVAGKEKKNISIKVNSERKRFTAFRATKSSVKRKEKRNHGCFSNKYPLKSFLEQTMDKNEGDLS